MTQAEHWISLTTRYPSEQRIAPGDQGKTGGVFAKRKLSVFERNVAFYILLVMAIFMSPMFLFISRLYRVKKKGQREYSALAMEYVRSFDAKWLRGGVSPAESLLGSPDIQSPADMVNSLSTVRQMMIVPLGRKNLLTLLVAAAIPFPTSSSIGSASGGSNQRSLEDGVLILVVRLRNRSKIFGLEKRQTNLGFTKPFEVLALGYRASLGAR